RPTEKTPPTAESIEAYPPCSSGTRPAQANRLSRSPPGRVAPHPYEHHGSAEREGGPALRASDGRQCRCQNADHPDGLHSDLRSAMVSGPARTTSRKVRRRAAFSVLT